MTLPDVALAYVGRHPAVVSVVVGARGRAQVEQNVERALTPVPDAVWPALAEAGVIPADALPKDSA